MDLTKKFGKRLRELRKRKGLTQERLAELLGMETNNISKLELGEHLPKKENLELLSKVLDVDIKELFDFNAIKPKETLIKEINEIIKNSDQKHLELYYKFMTSIQDFDNN